MRQTPLEALHTARGVRWRSFGEWQVPASFAGLDEEYRWLTESAAVSDWCHRQRLFISGRDRVSWLNGQVTQNIAAMPPNTSAPATLITPQGQMVAELRVLTLSDALLLDFPPDTATPMAEYLERYLIMERAEIEDVTDSWAQLSVDGPKSAAVIACCLGCDCADLDPSTAKTLEFRGEPLHLVRTGQCGEDGFSAFLPAKNAAAFWSTLSLLRPECGMNPIGWDALNVRRIEAGIPWWGAELDGKIVPLEARLENAVDYNKGCYVGQEIIARIHARGHVNNLLCGFLVSSDSLPVPGAVIQHEGKKVGRITSATHSPTLKRGIALGFLRRELQTPGASFTATAPEGADTWPLEVTPLPFLADAGPRA